MEILENYKKLLEWQREGKQTALSTVIWKQGSALRSVGAKMAISSDMEMSGSVSGGCVEGAVVQEALKVMESGKPALLEYGIADETAWSVGLACGGTIKVLVQKVEQEDQGELNTHLVKHMVALLESGTPFASLTKISTKNYGQFRLLKDQEIIPDGTENWVDPGLLDNVRSLEKTESSRIVEAGISRCR
jgi:xanthine/CO dehydrogenase XdhC/CoxF family maturation factor